ncbi:putative spermidine/putrescine transport system permease protein [Stella humosa]|uniref:Putative spermidine/putrescine transport system permease protein n=1 Tax=Stella humosa TaxID=94 RepID=A0A3N1L0C1_9PROT|nr:ABC transporter permease [Stella humosa]ROP83906.1 putative spermidine/putrescine transport system permease protein [Stella humosa]BBK32832.1 ABC transporter permease [Stella humosa]
MAMAGSARVAASERRAALGAFLLTAPGMIFLGLLFAVPLLQLFALSVEGGTTEWYAKVFADGLYTTIFLRTFQIALMVTAAALLIGYPVAFFLATTTPGWRALGFALVMLPFWTSVLVRTYAWMIILGRNGIVNRFLIDYGFIDRPLTLLNTRFAVVLGMVHVMLPFMILPLYSAIARVDPDFARAARGMGASRFQIFRRIYLPLTLHGVVAGVTLVFVVSLGFYITPALLGGGKVTMIAMVIEQQVREFLAWNFAGALSAVLLAITLAVFWLLNRWVAARVPPAAGQGR